MDKSQHEEQSYHFQLYKRYPVTIARGKGAKVWDTDGNEYIDILAGIAVNNLGHCHPAIVNAIKEQAEKLLHVSNFYYTEAQSTLAKRLAVLSGLDRVFFCNSGAEAMETCVKLARKWGNKHGKNGSIISLTKGFHGRTMTTLTMSAPYYQQGYDPLPEGFLQAPFNDLGALEAMIDDQTIAIAFELIQGNSGIHIADKEYVQSIRRLCDERNILLMIDEVQTGIARTGAFWSYEHYGIKPDVVAAAKALAGGIPIGAVMATEDASSAFDYGSHGTTFGGNPFACAVANACLTAIEEDHLVQQAAEKGAYFMNSLSERFHSHPEVKDIRGMGLMIGLELTKEARPVVERMFERRVLSNAAGGTVLRIVPPIVISHEEIDTVVDVIAESIPD